MAQQGVGEKAARERIRVCYYALLLMHRKLNKILTIKLLSTYLRVPKCYGYSIRIRKKKKEKRKREPTGPVIPVGL